MKLGERVALVILFSGINWLTASSALAQTKGGVLTMKVSH